MSLNPDSNLSDPSLGGALPAASTIPGPGLASTQQPASPLPSPSPSPSPSASPSVSVSASPSTATTTTTTTTSLAQSSQPPVISATSTTPIASSASPPTTTHTSFQTQSAPRPTTIFQTITTGQGSSASIVIITQTITSSPSPSSAPSPNSDSNQSQSQSQNNNSSKIISIALPCALAAFITLITIILIIRWLKSRAAKKAADDIKWPQVINSDGDRAALYPEPTRPTLGHGLGDDDDHSLNHLNDLINLNSNQNQPQSHPQSIPIPPNSSLSPSNTLSNPTLINSNHSDLPPSHFHHQFPPNQNLNQFDSPYGGYYPNLPQNSINHYSNFPLDQNSYPPFQSLDHHHHHSHSHLNYHDYPHHDLPSSPEKYPQEFNKEAISPNESIPLTTNTHHPHQFDQTNFPISNQSQLNQTSSPSSPVLSEENYYNSNPSNNLTRRTSRRKLVATNPDEPS